MRVWTVIDYDDIPPTVEGVFSSPENVVGYLRGQLFLVPEDCCSQEWAVVLEKLKTEPVLHLTDAGGNIMVTKETVDWWYEKGKYNERKEHNEHKEHDKAREG